MTESEYGPTEHVCRKYAEQCLQLLDRSSDPGSKVWLLAMASSWLKLAEQAEKNRTADLTFETPLPREE